MKRPANHNCVSKGVRPERLQNMLEAGADRAVQAKLVTTLRPLGLISVSRTGAVAMTKGDEVFTQ